MRPHWNPFRSRSTEQQRDVRSFLRNFGAGVLEMLPETLWDRPLVIRSAPGGGKTTLMRLFAADSLIQIADRLDDFPDLANWLKDVGAFRNGRPTVLGVMLSLDRDYRSILDLGAPSEVANRLFFRLLDGRIMLAVVRAAVSVFGGDPNDLAREVNGKSHRFKFGGSVCGRPYHRYRPLPMTEVSQLLSCERLADVFFFDRPGAAALALAEAHAKAGRLVVYEPSSAGNPGAHMRAAACADVIKYSEEQAPNFEKYFPELPPNHQLRIITRGDKGVLFRLGPEAWREQPAHGVSAVDTGGAGDWMTAALLDCLGLHRPWQAAEVEEAVRWAQGVAAMSCLVPGARLLASILESGVLRQQVKALLSEGTLKQFEPKIRRIRRTPKRCEECRLPFKTSGKVPGAPNQSP